MGAPGWATKGATGLGVKVAILDLGFGGYTNLLGTELPSTVTARSFRADGDITGGGESHGSAVGEIVYDIAPDARFYLVNAGLMTEMSKAVDYLIEQKVSVVNYSVGWECAGPLNGTGPVNDIVRKATSNNILWVNSAGNDGKHHWSGTFSDPDSNGWHNFQGADEGNSYPMSVGDEVAVCLQWDDWKATSRDYDLYVLDSANSVVASSKNRQGATGFGQPIETLDFTALTSGRYSFAIQNVNGAPPLPMHLFVHVLKANGGQSCVTEAALANQRDGTATANAFRGLRNSVLDKSGPGRFVREAYYRHSSELTRLLLADVGRSIQTVDLLASLRPPVQSLTAILDGEPGASELVSANLVIKTRAIFDYLESVSSAALLEDLRALRSAADLEHAAGRNVVDYWQAVGERLPSRPPIAPLATTQVEPIEYSVPATSLGVPSDSPDVLSVGAVYHADGTLEDYSSQGPTVDGRLKPEITAPTRICTVTYGRCGDIGFPGTSSSAPHVTGAAVLVKQARPTFSRTDIQTFLQQRAVDGGLPGPDSQYGYGVLSLGSVPSDLSATVALDRTALTFGATSSGAAFLTRTDSQSVRLFQQGFATVRWSIRSNQPWLSVSPSSGTGPAVLTVGVAFSSGLPLSGSVSGALSGTLTGASNAVAPLPVTLRISTPATSAPPFGGIDTPSDGVVNLSGSVAVTGWALDDVDVTEVQIWRDPHPTDPAGAVFGGPAPQGGKVFIGYASFVEGARPDVETRNPSSPRNSRAGWGYLLLTRGLVWDGKGAFKLHAIAADRDGHLTLVGSKTISINNSSASVPFGAVDTPAQGGTVSGVYGNTGWVITPNPGASIAAAGVKVSIDGVFLPGVPSVSNRSDITAGFPSLNTSGAGRGLFIDTTQYTNGVHVIGWLVTDSAGKADGVGSRFFTVSNSALRAVDPPTPGDGRAVASMRTSPAAVRVKHGGSPAVSLVDYGIREVHVSGLDRVEVQLPNEGYDQGYVRSGDRLLRLPIGSHLERGVFTWQITPGFIGAYDLVFITRRGGAALRTDLRVVVDAQ
jgi:hypothetical protein